ncbi:MAG: CvpA family protein [Bacteroidota bacterium]
MVLDIIGGILLVLFFICGYQKGLIIAIFSFVGILLGAIFAMKFSQTLAQYLLDKGIITSGWGQVICYVLMFLIVVVLVWLLARLIDSALKAVMLGTINKLLGALLYVGITSFMWSSILWLCDKMHLISPATISKSYTYHFFAPIAPWVFTHIGGLLPFAKNMMADLQHFFDHVNKQLPDHVGTHR